MARPQRIEYEGAVYPVTARGNERRAILEDDADREHFLRLLGESTEQYQVRLYLFCLMAARVPLFVKDNSIVPVAKPVENVADDTVFAITARVYGDKPVSFALFEDDGVSFDYEKGEFNKVILSWQNGRGNVERAGSFPRHGYQIVAWDKIARYNPQ